MTEANSNLIESQQPTRMEGPLELRVWEATDEQLASGLSAAREALAARSVTAGHAVVCHSAVAAHELDPSLPEPDAEVRAGADACREAYVAAILVAGGRLDRDDALAFEQSPEDGALWDALPTLRAWRTKNNSPFVADTRRAVPPTD